MNSLLASPLGGGVLSTLCSAGAALLGGLSDQPTGQPQLRALSSSSWRTALDADLHATRRAMEGTNYPLVGSSPVHEEWELDYRPLPVLFLLSFGLWSGLLLLWTWNTWSKRRWQNSSLQWSLALLPMLKCFVLGLSFLFWFWCLNWNMCSFWVAFGVFVSRIFFETTCFICFLLIAHGFGITQEALPASQRRTIAGLSCLLYISLTAYKASLPHFQVIVAIVYIVLLYIIFSGVSTKVRNLQDQLLQIGDVDENSNITRILLHKCLLFRSFQFAMIMMVLLEVLLHVPGERVGGNNYWLRLVLRESAELGIFVYMGWIFRSRKTDLFLTLFPVQTADQPASHFPLPPIHKVEMDQEEFENLQAKEWHIGICHPTRLNKDGVRAAPALVFVHHPGDPEDLLPVQRHQRSEYHQQPHVEISMAPLMHCQLGNSPAASDKSALSRQCSPVLRPMPAPCSPVLRSSSPCSPALRVMHSPCLPVLGATPSAMHLQGGYRAVRIHHSPALRHVPSPCFPAHQAGTPSSRQQCRSHGCCTCCCHSQEDFSLEVDSLLESGKGSRHLAQSRAPSGSPLRGTSISRVLQWGSMQQQSPSTRERRSNHHTHQLPGVQEREAGGE